MSQSPHSSGCADHRVGRTTRRPNIMKTDERSGRPVRKWTLANETSLAHPTAIVEATSMGQIPVNSSIKTDHSRAAGGMFR